MATDQPHLAAAIPASGTVSLRVYTPSGPPEIEDQLPSTRRLRNGRGRRILVGIFALWMFLAAIAVMKEGAAPLGDLLRGSTLTDSVASTMGFGWLGAMLVMSGSPVAVASLTMLGADAISPIQSLSMLTGSRLGASFVVLTVSFLYATRSRAEPEQRRASISIGIYCLLLTAIVYLPALAMGVPLLRRGVLDSFEPAAPGAVLDIVDTIIGPVVDLLVRIVPDTPGLLFLAGMALLLTSVRLVDLALPEANDAAQLEDHTDWRSRKWRMFAVGSVVALVTMSVSVALTVLVPAVSKGYFRRRQVMPYIMGANITTLGDTLLTAFLVENPAAIHVVITELVTITFVTLLLLFFAYGWLQLMVMRVTDWILDKGWRLAGFVGLLFTLPLMLVLLP